LEIGKEENDHKPLVHYRFNETNTYETTFRGRKAIGVRDLGKGRPADLVIPTYFTPYKRAFLEIPPMSLRDYKRNIVEDMVVNLFGFMPLGMLLFMVLERKDLGMGVCLVLAVALGLSVSLTIELLQAYLPTRNSSMLDLIMNTTGTLIGAFGMAVKVKAMKNRGMSLSN
jgi:VanZ family protein